MPDRIFNGLLIAQLVVFVAYSGVVMAMTHRLRTRHAEAWNGMIQFTLFANNSPAGSLKFLRYFVFSSAYRALGDTMLGGLTIALRVLFWTFVAIFAVMAVGVFAK